MNIIYVDDEVAAVEKFEYIIHTLDHVTTLKTFTEAAPAQEYAEQHTIDIAFLDIEMPGIRGLELAKILRKINSNTKIVFLTAYDTFALDAFDAEAVSYILKPYNKECICQAIEKAEQIIYTPTKQVFIRTLPFFDVYVNHKLLYFNSEKAKELLAVLVDAAGGSVTTEQIIGHLWADRPYDAGAQALCRVTYKRLREILNIAGIGFILASGTAQRFVHSEFYESDYKRLLTGDEEVIAIYDGRYMAHYSWAEETNARIQSYINSLK